MPYDKQKIICTDYNVHHNQEQCTGKPTAIMIRKSLQYDYIVSDYTHKVQSIEIPDFDLEIVNTHMYPQVIIAGDFNSVEDHERDTSNIITQHSEKKLYNLLEQNGFKDTYSRNSLMRPPMGLSKKWSLGEVVSLVKGWF